SPMWETRWRWNATRALAVLRHSGGKRTPPQLVRMRAADLAAAVFPAQAGCQDNHGGGDLELPDHPLVNETARDCLREAMDVDGLKRVLQRLRAGTIATLARDTVAPSPWSHGILAANPYAYLDDAPLEERRTRAVSTSRPGELDSREAGLVALDAAAIAQVVDEVRPDPRDADELHDYLCTAAIVPARAAWRPLFEELRAAGRAALCERGGSANAWVPAERIALVRAVWPAATLTPPLAAPIINDAREWDGEEAAAQIVGAHLQTTGPETAAAVAAALDLDADRVNAALARLEADGQILRGRFTPGGSDEEWCERRILQRIHRRTLGKLREDIRPVTPAELIRFLLRWQHVAPGTRLHGVEGVAKVIEQLEGLQLQPAAWERDVLPARVESYQPAWLDELCLSGEVAWARLELAPPVEGEPAAANGKRPRNASGSIGLFQRAHAAWLVDRGPPGSTPASPATWAHLSPPARAVAAELEKRGAAFAADLCASLGRAPSEIDDALWELVRTGAVSSDGFSGLRALAASRETRSAGPRRLVQGRWSLIHRDAPPPSADAGPFGDGSPVEHARLYLRRYGVVLRALLERETCAPPWRDLVAVYRRLEARGEIRGGRFVSGLSGEQFALPEAVEALRALRRIAASPEDAVVAATDPLNLVGILTPGARVPAVAGHSVRYQDGVPAAAMRSLA
ncbi:MAG TPA: DEAD/DEAH box helicase, partial [Polyangia bacterium]|nr:DEAD/DEAH box helicase [Polyangia bacterium]